MLLLLTLATLQATELSAQRTRTTTRSTQRETVILHRNNDGPTTVEINDDGVFLNGEQIATRTDINNRGLSKKVIINGGQDSSPSRSYDDYYNSRGGRATNPGRAMLGVFTDPRRSGDGAYIQNVSPNSSAATAGLVQSDVITRVDDQGIYTADDLTKVISSYRPGDRVTISYNRRGKDRQTTATLGQAPENNWAPAPPETMDNDERMPTPPPFPGDEAFGANRPKLGVSVEEVSGTGVRIKSVREGSVADAAGFREGDIITAVDNVKIDDVSELQNTVGNLEPGARVRIDFNRNGSRMSRTVTMNGNKSTRDL